MNAEPSLRTPSLSARPARVALALVVLAASASAQSQGVVTRVLNRPLERAPGGGFQFPLVSPDGENVVYSSDPEGDFTWVLNSCPLNGSGAPVTLDALGLLGFTLDGKRCLVLDDADGDGAHEIALVPTTGGASAQVLDELVPGGTVQSVVFTEDKQRLLYLADRDTRDVTELYRVSLAGGPGVRLSAPLPAGQRVLDFRLAPDQVRAVYAEGPLSSIVALSSVAIDGSAPVSPLPVALAPGRSIRAWDLDSAGTRVLYVADADVDEVFELHSIAADGSQPPLRLSAPLAPGFDVDLFWQPDPSRVLFTVTDAPNTFPGAIGFVELYVVPIDGSQAPVLLASVPEVQLVRPVGQRVVLVARDAIVPSSWRLLSASIDAPAPLLDLSGPLSLVSDVQAALGGKRALLSAVRTLGGPGELFSVPVDGSAALVRLNPALLPPGGGVVVSPLDGIPTWWEMRAGVLFTVRLSGNEPAELFLAPSDGSAPARRLASGPVRELFPATSPLFFWSGGVPVRDFGRALFVGNGSLQSVALSDGPKPVTLEAGSRASVVGRVQAFDLSAAGERALYVAQEEEDGTVEAQLYSVRTGERPERVRIPVDPLDNLESVRLSPDGTRAVFTVLRGAERHLFGVASAGGLPALLSGPGETVVGAVHFSPDGARLVYFATLGGRTELFGAPLDGSAPSVLLSAALPVGALPENVAFSADGARIAFRSAARELYTVPANGSQAALHFPATHEVEGDFALSSDGASVVFRTNPDGGRKGELFIAPSDGSAAPERLNGLLPTGNDVRAFVPTRAADRAFYLAGQDTPGVVELYSVPTDGSAAPIRMHAPLSGGRDVAELRLSADERWVVFRADARVDNQDELFAVPTDLSRAPVRLSGAFVAGGDVLEFALTPDSRRVVYRADAQVDGREQLFSVPIGGARAPDRLRSPVHPSGKVHSFRISADSRAVAFLAERPEAERCSLVSAFLDGAKPVELTGPFLFRTFDPLFEYDLGPDGRSAAYRVSPAIGEELRFARDEGSTPALRGPSK